MRSSGLFAGLGSIHRLQSVEDEVLHFQRLHQVSVPHLALVVELCVRACVQTVSVEERWCVCVCVSACAFECVRACMCVCVGMCVHECVYL